MTLAKFYSGTSTDLDKKEQEAGSIYFTTDTQEIVVDMPEGKRLTFGKQDDFKEISDSQVDEIFNKYFK